jgi:hypothetical protein
MTLQIDDIDPELDADWVDGRPSSRFEQQLERNKRSGGLPGRGTR